MQPNDPTAPKNAAEAFPEQDSHADPVALGVAEAQTEGESRKKNVQALFKNPRTRNVLILTFGSMTLLMALAAYQISHRAPTTATNLPPDMRGAAVTPPEVTPTDKANPQAQAEHNKMVQEFNKAGAQQAVAQGGSYVATPPSGFGGPVSADPAANPAAQGQSQQDQIAAQIAMEREKARAAEDAFRVKAKAQAIKDMMDGPIAKMENQGQQTVIFMNPAPVAGKPSSGSPTGSTTSVVPNASGGIGANVNSQNGLVLLEPGIYLARNEIGVQTDISAPASAVLLTGPLAGSRLIGGAQREGYKAKIQYTYISLPNGKGTTPALAYALDAQTLYSGVATEVDRKLLTRYGLLPLAAGLTALGQVASMGSGTSAISNGTVVENRNPLSSRETYQVVGGALANQLAKDISASSLEPVVSVAPDAEIAIFVAQPVIYTPKSN